MKIKIIILTLAVFILSGCFNYVEINNLVLVTGIGIDYKDDMYEVSFETLYQDKESSDSSFEKGTIRSGKGKTLGEAFDNVTLSVEKEPYFAHLKVLVISNEVAKNHLNEICDFFLRNNDIRNIFSVVIADESTPEEILNNSDNYFPVASEKINSLLENNVYSNYISKNKYFKNIASNYLSKNKNIALTSIKIEEDNLKLGDLIVFNSKKPVGKLDDKMSLVLSVLDNKKPSSLFTITYDDNEYITLRIYKSKTKVSIEKNKFVINNDLMAEIVENSYNIDLDKKSNQNKIESDFSKLIDKEATDLINYLQSINSDILGINEKYYIKYRKRSNTYFKSSSFKVKTKVQINKKGLTFEVIKW